MLIASEEYDGEQDTLAAMFVRRGRPQEALLLFDKLLGANPTQAGYYADRSEALLALGRTDDAIKSLRRSVELDPNMDITHDWLAAALAKDGDLRGAEAEYKAGIAVYNTEYGSGGSPTDEMHAVLKGLVDVNKKFQSETVLATMRLKLILRQWRD